MELREGIRYYRANAGSSVAHDFKDATRRATRQLLEHPEIGMLIKQNIRRFPLHDYPYNLVYRVTPQAIIVIALAHQSRRPGYWAGQR